MYVWQKSYNDHLDNAICLCLHHTSREILNTMIVHATDPCADIYLLSKRQLEHNTGSRVKSPHSVTMVQKYSQVLGATKFSHTSSITQNQQQILIHMYWSEHEQYINRFFYKNAPIPRCSTVDERRWSAKEGSGHKWGSAVKVVRRVGEVWRIPHNINLSNSERDEHCQEQ